MISNIPDKRHQGLIMATAAVTFWSVGAYLLCLARSVPPCQISAIAQIIGGSICLAACQENFGFVRLVDHLRSRWAFVALLAINQLCYVFAFRAAPPVHVDLINYLWPAMLIVGEAWRRNHKISSLQVLGICTGFLGASTLLIPELLEANVELSYVYGYLAALAAALSWTCYSVLGKSQHSTRDVGRDILLSGMVMVCLQSALGSWQPMKSKELFSSVSMGILSYGLAFPLWKKGLKLADYRIVGSIGNAIPVLSVAWLILGGISDFTWTIAAATLLVTLGCYMLGTDASEAEAKLEPALAPSQEQAPSPD